MSRSNFLYIPIVLIFLSVTSSLTAQNAPLNPSVLAGKWILDFTPHEHDDAKFASMEITKAKDSAFEGYFYRTGVKITEGQINLATGKIHAALVSGDGTGLYNTSFYFENDTLFGTTHSIDKDFLAVWTGVRELEKFKPRFEVSTNPTHKIPEGQEYVFGYLEVLENRNNPKSKTIKVPVYIFKSRSEHPKLDPIIYTVGGPGSSTMPSAQYMNYYKYLDDRDFILIEQRGNYYAQPHLDCPEWSNAIYESNLPDFDKRNSDSLLQQAAIACRERLVENGIDLNGYNTKEIAQDIADLVQVLEIERYNLLTISYSTKIAQVLLRDYPAEIRSVVMDSPLPLEVNYDEESVGHILLFLKKLLTDCATNLDCNRVYPDLKERFINYLKEKTRNPLTVSVKNPRNGNLERFKLRGEDLINVFTAASNVADVPFEINKLLNNDLSTIKEQLSNLFQEPAGGAGMGMRLSVWCAEEYPFNNQEIIAKETYAYPEVAGLSPAVFDSSICNIWSVTKATSIENEAVKSDIPILLINGEFDNETPVKWAIDMRKNLSNTYHLIFKGWKHGPTTNWSNQCAMEAANNFFNHPSIKPSPDCLEKIVAPKFKLE